MKNHNYKICTKCVMDTSDPFITFDADGVCSHCNSFHKNVEPYWKSDLANPAKLESTVAAIKKEGEGKEYDCLLGLSGGLDSSFMLHQAVKVFGLRPLVFHVDGGWNTPESESNVRSMVEKLGLGLKVTKIDWEEMRNFQLALFRSGTPYLDMAQDHCFVATLYNYALENGIKYILNGGNLSTECIPHSSKYYYWGTDMWFINDVLKKFGEIPMKTYPFCSLFRHKIWLRYFKGLQVVRLLNYMPYSKQMALQVLGREYGWKDYGRKHFESVLTRYLEGDFMVKRYGYTPLREQLSALVVTDQMTRDEAVRILDSDEYPLYPEDLRHTDRKAVCDKLRISDVDMDGFLAMPKKYYNDYRNQKGIIDFGLKVLKMFHAEIARPY